MKHSRRGALGLAALRAFPVLVGVNACTREPRVIEPTPIVPSAAVEPPPAPPVRIDDETELGAACPSALAACPPNPTSPCRVSCQAAADGCAAVWELHPIAARPGSSGYWQAIHPDGEHGLFGWGFIDENEDYLQPESLTWGAEGVVSLSADVDDPEFFYLSRVSDDVSVAIGAISLDRIFWSREGGIQPLGVQNPALARDGSLVAGQLGRRAVRWVPGENTTTVFEFENDRYSPYAAGGAALFLDERRLVYNARAGEVSVIEAPPDAPPDATFKSAAMSLDGASFVVTFGTSEEYRVYRWAEGELASLDLLSRAPGDTQYVDLHLSDDGNVLIAEVLESFPSQRVIRWSAATGSQLLSEDPMLYVAYVSPTGDVFLGGSEVAIDTEDERDIGVRWSVQDGMHETPPLYAPEHAALDGDVLVDIDADGPIIHKYGRALAGTLPLEHLRGRLLPSRWSSATIMRVSPNGRTLAGTADLEPANPPRAPILWLARLRDVCPG